MPAGGLRNALDNNEPASFHPWSALYMTATGAPALAANPDATAYPVPGDLRVVVLNTSPRHPLLHSHGNTRLQTAPALRCGIVSPAPAN
jgi:hypothetical protein